MAGKVKTTKKQRGRPLTGSEGNTFSKDNQPAPELKKAGWEEWRKKRYLTAAIHRKFLGTDPETDTTTIDGFVETLQKLMSAGNSKAVEIIYKCLEDDIQKVEHSGGVNVNWQETKSYGTKPETNPGT